jgi:hypothetical protein
MYTKLLKLYPSRRETSSSVILKMQPCERRTAKEKSTTNSHSIPLEDVLPYVHLTRAVLYSYRASRHATSATTDIRPLVQQPSARAGNSENRSVSTGSQFD